MKETQTDSKKSTLEVTNALVQANIARKSLICYTSTTWSTAGTGTLNLVTTSGGSTAATLPKGCRVVSVKITTVTAVTSGGSATYDIGTNTTSATSSNNIFDGLLLSNIGTVGNIVWGSMGRDVTGLLGLTAESYLTITTNVAATTAGALKLDILYEV